MNDELRTYIEGQQKLGVDTTTIKTNLISNGWSEDVVDQALNPNSPTAASVQSGSESKDGMPVWAWVLIGVGIALLLIPAILAPIVLGSLNDAREKGLEASIKANLSGIRATAEIYYDDNESYDGVCDTFSVANTLENVRYDSRDVTCADSIDSYAVQAALVSGGYFCIDSSWNGPQTVANRFPIESTFMCSQ